MQPRGAKAAPCCASRLSQPRSRVLRRALSSSASASPPPSALVVGAGVSGLSCAVRLAEAGFDVSVLAHKAEEDIVSFGAGALYEYPPYRVQPEARTFPWALAARDAFEALASSPSAADAGCVVRRLRYVYDAASPVPDEIFNPPFAALLRNFASGEAPTECGPGFAASWGHDVPVVCMRLYLPWLKRVAASLGVRFLPLRGERLRSLDETGADEHTLVVNCAALGSRELVNDDQVGPVRGVLVYVESPVEHVYSQEPRGESTTPTYIIPQVSGIVALGGYAQPGASSLEVTDEEVADIRRRCERLLPSLKGARVVRTWAGLRPYRGGGGVRLEFDAGRQNTLHCYGHGGSGVTLSWGCAAEVAELATAWAETRLGGGLAGFGGAARAPVAALAVGR